jgi:excinuclease UvrABC nuclease subunit
VERVLPAVERLEFREAGSPFEARLDEIGLIADLRPNANRQGTRPDRLAYLRLEREGLPRLVVADAVGVDGTLHAGPVGRRSTADDVARALRLAFGLRSCRAARPVEEGCLEGRLGRCLAPCRGDAERAAHAEAASALADALAGGSVPIPRLRRRRASLAAAHRFEEAARLRDAEASLREAGGELRRVRAARALHGVVLAAHRDPRLVQAFAVAYGLVVERRPIPRAGDAGLETSAVAAAVTRAVGRGPGPEGLHALPAERRDEALHVAAAFSRPSSAHVAVAGAGAGLARAVAAARTRL